MNDGNLPNGSNIESCGKIMLNVDSSQMPAAMSLERTRFCAEIILVFHFLPPCFTQTTVGETKHFYLPDIFNRGNLVLQATNCSQCSYLSLSG
jgi:hypothetical protein